MRKEIFVKCEDCGWEGAEGECESLYLIEEEPVTLMCPWCSSTDLRDSDGEPALIGE